MDILKRALPYSGLTQQGEKIKPYKIIWNSLLRVSFYDFSGIPVDAYTKDNCHFFNKSLLK
jgi:hypothetical protein